MNYFFIKIVDFLPDFLQEIANGFPNIKNRFGHYLFHLVFGTFPNYNLHLGTDHASPTEKQQGNGKQNYLLNRVIKKYRPDVKAFISVDDMVPYFLNECEEKFLVIDKSYASYLLRLLVHDVHNGLDFDVSSRKINVCSLQNFLERSLLKYANPLDATICSTRICYYFKHYHELNLDYVTKKYESKSKEKINNLCRTILQYPENSNLRQLDEMFVKMQIFIITNYCIGRPDNSVLLKQTRQSLTSVLGKGDLQKYVLKKKYHRLEYLQRLGATVCGIIIFNNYKPQSKNNDVRNIFLDLQMAQRNTKESLEAGLARASSLIQKGTDTLKENMKIIIDKRIVQYKWPWEKLHEVNKFIVLFHLYKRCLSHVTDVFEKNNHLINVTQGKFDSVMDKINEILKFRSAVESALIFPHFVYLSDVWKSLVLYLNHLVEINKVKDNLDDLLNEKVENSYHSLLGDTNDKECEYAIEFTFDELLNTNNKREAEIDIKKIKPFVKDYCALTMILTNGILVPSQLEKKLCENGSIFGFENIEFAEYSEMCFPHFIDAFEKVIISSVDMILLLQLDDEILQQEVDMLEKSVAKRNTSCTQTELHIHSSYTNSIATTWNIWDYHRETIRLANVRQLQTNSTQTRVSFGKKNSQNLFLSNVDT